MYARKCKKDPKALLDLMKVGGWLTAKEALDWGFVDEITDLDETSPKLTDAVAAELAAAGIPIPNLPIADRENAFARFLAAFASLFKPKTDTTMNQESTTQEPTANAVDSRIAELEASLAERDATIADLQKQINELKAAPGAQSTAVVEQPSAQTTEDPLAEYFRDTAEAKAILSQL